MTCDPFELIQQLRNKKMEEVLYLRKLERNRKEQRVLEELILNEGLGSMLDNFKANEAFFLDLVDPE